MNATEKLITYFRNGGDPITFLDSVNDPELRILALSQEVGRANKVLASEGNGETIEADMITLPSGKRVAQYRWNDSQELEQRSLGDAWADGFAENH